MRHRQEVLTEKKNCPRSRKTSGAFPFLPSEDSSVSPRFQPRVIGAIFTITGRILAEGEGFEPSDVLPSDAFKATALNLSAILPWQTSRNRTRIFSSPSRYVSMNEETLYHKLSSGIHSRLLTVVSSPCWVAREEKPICCNTAEKTRLAAGLVGE